MAEGAHRLFNLATLASSTMVLNVMSPLLGQLGHLAPMLTQAKRTLIDRAKFIADPPSLLVLERGVQPAWARTSPWTLDHGPWAPDLPGPGLRLSPYLSPDLSLPPGPWTPVLPGLLGSRCLRPLPPVVAHPEGRAWSLAATDARLAAPTSQPKTATPSSLVRRAGSPPASLLGYAWLEPQGDSLDAAREAVRAIFPNRTVRCRGLDPGTSG